MRRLFILLISLSFISLSVFSQSDNISRESAMKKYAEAQSIAAQEMVGRYASRETVEKILSCYEEVTSIDNTIFTAWLNQAIAHCALKDFKSALADIDSADANVQVDTDLMTVELHKGYIMEHIGNIKEASEYYEMALEHCEKQPDNSMDYILQKWECLLAARGLDTGSKYLETALADADMTESDRNIALGLIRTPVAKVKGRPWYISNKATGCDIVSTSDMEDMRIILDFYKHFITETRNDSPDFTYHPTGAALSEALASAVSANHYKVLNASREELKKYPQGEIYIEKANIAGWYKVKYHIKDFTRTVDVHTAMIQGQRLIDSINPDT